MIGLAVFVKTPGLSPIKTRLAASVGKQKAEDFYRLSCDWTSQLLVQVQRQSSVQVFWAVAESEALSSDCWKKFPTLYQGEGELGDRLYRVYENLYHEFGAAVVLGADSPELQPDFILKAIQELESPSGHSFVLGKTHDGGFYILGGKMPLPKKVWTSVAYSQNTTGNAIEEKLQSLGKVQNLPLCADVDTLDDLRSVLKRIQNTSSEKYSSLLALQLI